MSAGKGDRPRTTAKYWKSSYWLKRDAEAALPSEVASQKEDKREAGPEEKPPEPEQSQP